MAELMADPPFARGATLGVTSTQGGNVAGVVKLFLDADPRQPVNRFSNRLVKCVAVRNARTDSTALLPKQVVKFKPAALLSEVDGLADNTHSVIGVVDEYLPTAGCAVGDICWVVVQGPSTCLKTATSVSAGAGLGSSTTAGYAASGTNLGLALATSATTETRVQVTTTHSA